MAVTGEDDVVGDIVVAEDGVLYSDKCAGRWRNAGKVIWIVIIENFKVVEDITESCGVESEKLGLL